MRGAFLSFVLVASLLLVACGGGDEGRGDLANSKVFDPAVVKRCLRDQGFRIEPRLGAGDAESREKEWRSRTSGTGRGSSAV